MVNKNCLTGLLAVSVAMGSVPVCGAGSGSPWYGKAAVFGGVALLWFGGSYYKAKYRAKLHRKMKRDSDLERMLQKGSIDMPQGEIVVGSPEEQEVMSNIRATLLTSYGYNWCRLAICNMMSCGQRPIGASVELLDKGRQDGLMAQQLVSLSQKGAILPRVFNPRELREVIRSAVWSLGSAFQEELAGSFKAGTDLDNAYWSFQEFLSFLKPRIQEFQRYHMNQGSLAYYELIGLNVQHLLEEYQRLCEAAVERAYDKIKWDLTRLGIAEGQREKEDLASWGTLEQRKEVVADLILPLLLKIPNYRAKGLINWFSASCASELASGNPEVMRADKNLVRELLKFG